MTERWRRMNPRALGFWNERTWSRSGRGSGQDPETVQFVRSIVEQTPLPMIVDADGLNALAGRPTRYRWPRIFTPHPGEMSRLNGRSIAQIQSDRIGTARTFAIERGVYLVLKGNRSVVAAPDGRVWINPTGSPSMATGGTGDVLTGMIAGIGRAVSRSSGCRAAGRGLFARQGRRAGCGEARRKIADRDGSFAVSARGDA